MFLANELMLSFLEYNILVNVTEKLFIFIMCTALALLIWSFLIGNFDFAASTCVRFQMVLNKIHK